MDYHDILSIMGEGSAHPGGYEGTLKLLQKGLIPPKSRILEVGCGTGRSACLLAASGYKVTAVDKHPTMLRKAQERAGKHQLDIRFVQGNAEKLPFQDESFDVVFVESVTLFVNPAVAMHEYCRVLSPGGLFIDNELCALRRHWKLELQMQELYGIQSLPDLSSWQKVLAESYFSRTQVIKAEPEYNPLDQKTTKTPSDPDQMIDFAELIKPEVTRFIAKHEQFMTEYEQDFTYVILLGEK